jgi:hypothetical protein
VTRLASISRSVVSPVTIPAFLRLILTAGLRFRIELFGSVSLGLFVFAVGRRASGRSHVLENHDSDCVFDFCVSV